MHLKLSFIVMALADFQGNYSYQNVSINALLTPDKVG